MRGGSFLSVLLIVVGLVMLIAGVRGRASLLIKALTDE